MIFIGGDFAILLEMKPFYELKHFGKYDAAIATVNIPFEIGIPFSNPICLYPKEVAGIESDWDGAEFYVLGKQYSNVPK